MNIDSNKGDKNSVSSATMIPFVLLSSELMMKNFCQICLQFSKFTYNRFTKPFCMCCDHCYSELLKRFKDNWSLNLQKQHENCQSCLNMFDSEVDIINHDCTCINFYKCSNCLIILPKKIDLINHMRKCMNIDLESSYGKTQIERTRDICNSNSSTSKLLGNNVCKNPRRSVKKIKSLDKNKKFNCNECNKSLSNSSHLKRHLLVHLGVKQHNCEKCKKSFSQSNHLKRHLLTHSGEKPHHCVHCKKSFSILHNLKRHLLIHSGEKPYHCKQCKKSFSNSGHLKTHLRVHSGEKPYHCVHCKKSFSYSGSLKTHLFIHTREKP